MENTMSTLVNLLIKKGIITKEEYREEFDRVRRLEWDKKHKPVELEHTCE